MSPLKIQKPFPPSRIPAGNDSFPGTRKALWRLVKTRSRLIRSQSRLGTLKSLIYMRFPVPGVSLLQREGALGMPPLGQSVAQACVALIFLTSKESCNENTTQQKFEPLNPS